MGPACGKLEACACSPDQVRCELLSFPTQEGTACAYARGGKGKSPWCSSSCVVAEDSSTVECVHPAWGSEIPVWTWSGGFGSDPLWVWAELQVRVRGGHGVHLLSNLTTRSLDPAALVTPSVGRLDQGVPPVRKPPWGTEPLPSDLGVSFGMARGWSPNRRLT